MRHFSRQAAVDFAVFSVGKIREVGSCRNLTKMERDAPKTCHSAVEFQQFLHASLCLNNPPERLPAVDPKDAEIFVTSRRLAKIVLSARDEEDLSQAIDEAYGHFEFARYYEAREFDPKFFEYARDPGTPIEFRELLVATFFGHIAWLVLQVAERDQLTVPLWQTDALQRYVEAGESAHSKWTMSDQQMEELNQRQSAREQAFNELLRCAAESGQDAFCPFGHPDD